jgi:phage terminase large subunit-like protein
VRFCAELLVHTKGPHKRTAFVLADWQEHEIARPLFGEVVWSQDWGCYVRRYRIAYIIVARKNGKSELAAAIQLYLLVGDDEESAEVYSAAKDTKQAGKVFEPALRMMQLSSVLSGRLKHNKNARRIYDEKTASHYEIITADAQGELGHNPHGFNLDEVLSQRDGSLWQAMTTAVGARLQELLFATSTETNDSASFGAELIDEAERVVEDPSRAPHVFAFVRKLPTADDQLVRLREAYRGHPDLPVSCDPFDEANWKWPNPALDDFLSREALRRDASEARNDPKKENGFRQFRANQRVQQVTRYVPMALWDANTGEVALTPDWLTPKLAGARCWGGLDLSSKLDLTAWALLFADGHVRWRFWAPESVAPMLDEHTGGWFSQWVKAGWVTLTEGDTIDYDRIYDDIEADHRRFAIVTVTYDFWCGEPVRQALVKRTGLEFVESKTTYERMTAPMTEFMRLLTAGGLAHGGNPVARWNADNLGAKSPTDDPDRVRPVKPDRGRSGKRIDGMPALFFAIDGRMRSDAALDKDEEFVPARIR